jgi:hypothetical protein
MPLPPFFAASNRQLSRGEDGQQQLFSENEKGKWTWIYHWNDSAAERRIVDRAIHRLATIGGQIRTKLN